MTVHFIGAGPGDPELITVRGLRLIESCPVCLYAGSLVPEAVVAAAPAEKAAAPTTPGIGFVYVCPTAEGVEFEPYAATATTPKFQHPSTP